jgi:hypothetical protein
LTQSIGFTSSSCCCPRPHARILLSPSHFIPSQPSGAISCILHVVTEVWRDRVTCPRLMDTVRGRASWIPGLHWSCDLGRKGLAHEACSLGASSPLHPIEFTGNRLQLCPASPPNPEGCTQGPVLLHSPAQTDGFSWRLACLEHASRSVPPKPAHLGISAISLCSVLKIEDDETLEKYGGWV